MDFQELLNTIRDNASKEYQERIPEATQTNLSEIGGVLLEDVNLANEFTSALMNKVAFTKVHNKIFKNPLSILKKGQKPFADTVEEIFVNYAKGKSYDETGADLLSREKPDVKAIYHQMNRQDKYKVTIGMEQLQKAFRGYGDFALFYDAIINTLYNGDNDDEFILFKQMLKKATDAKFAKTVLIADPCTSKQNAIDFIKSVKTVSSMMKYPSDKYNGYLDAQSTDTKPVRTFTEVKDQYIIIDVATSIAIDVDVLANAFNMSKQEFLARRIEIDAFPDENIRAMVIDKDFPQIYDDLYQMRRFENGEGLYENYILHHWQTISTSCLVNAVAFSVGTDEDEDGKVEEFTVTNTLKTGVKTSNSRNKVNEGSSYTATLTGVGEDDTVTVTMGGTNVTSTAYDSETKKIHIADVTGNLAITVA